MSFRQSGIAYRWILAGNQSTPPMNSTMSRHNANFQDPVGLILRMLASKNRSAYGALLREGMRIGLTPVDLFLAYFEKRRLRKPRQNGQPLIFIVGSPRSGTTLVYQVLAHYLDVTFPPNTSAVFKRAPITAALLQSRLGRRAQPSFSNYYGQTSRLSDCNDAFDLWNRWLGEDRYAPATSISAEQSAEMKNFFATWTSAFGKPFLNKNNRNAFAIELLARTLPEANFVVVRRNPMMVAQSLIAAREKIQGDKNVAWGLDSQVASKTLTELTYIDAVWNQITSIDREMNRQLSTVAAERVVEITYETFCESPQTIVHKIASAFSGLSLSPANHLSDLQPFQVSQRVALTLLEQARLRQLMSSDGQTGETQYASSSATSP